MLKKIMANFFQSLLSSALAEYILEQSPPKMYIPETRPAMVALVPIEVAYSVTVDINAYITSDVNSNAPKIRKKDLVKILSLSCLLFINILYI